MGRPVKPGFEVSRFHPVVWEIYGDDRLLSAFSKKRPHLQEQQDAEQIFHRFCDHTLPRRRNNDG
jgi:hypothetical protein